MNNKYSEPVTTFISSTYLSLFECVVQWLTIQTAVLVFFLAISSMRDKNDVKCAHNSILTFC